MSMSTDITGYREKDKRWDEMVEVYKTCENAGVAIPSEVEEFFNGEHPDSICAMDGFSVDINCAMEQIDEEMVEGWWVDVEKLPKGVKIIRFANSY